MGAWGAGSFENDTAMDWAGEIVSLDDVRSLFDEFKRQTDDHPDQGAMQVEADNACELLAAAESVAMLLGREIAGFPEDLKAKLGDGLAESDLLFHQARNAVSHIMRNSELAELWDEATEEGEENEWLVELTDLIDRLNPEIEFVPRPIEQLEQEMGGEIERCAFCNEEVSTDQELFTMAISNYDDFSSMTRYFPVHLRCLNGRLHHKHALQNLKFDPDNLPDLDQL